MVTSVLPYLIKKGYKVATIKHDGHEFEPDVPGTDSYRHAKAGAYGTAVFSASQYMIVKQQPQVSEAELASYFPEADIILLEGFKFSPYPKLEIVRSEIRKESVCGDYHLEAIATDIADKFHTYELPVFPLDAYQEIADFIESRYSIWKSE